MTALVGATVLLLWVEPDVEKMLGAVDWTTLVFFMALFMLVGAVQEVGILGLIAGAMGNLIGQSVADAGPRPEGRGSVDNFYGCSGFTPLPPIISIRLRALI